MGFPFAEAEKRTTADAGGYPLTSYFLTGMRSGRFVVSGIPITMPPAELFTKANAHITHVFSFRLVSTDPIRYTLSFACFDEFGLMLGDFSTLIDEVNAYLSDLTPEDDDSTDNAGAKTPVEGAFILYVPNGEEPDSSLEVITLYPPNISFDVYNTILHQALWQGIKTGFSDNTA